MNSDKNILDIGGKSHGIAMNFLFMMAMRLLTASLSFLLIIYVARHWGVTELGAFSLLFSIFIFFQQMPMLGLHIAVIRDVGANPEKIRDIGKNTALISLSVSGALFFAIGFGGSAFYQHEINLHQPLWLVAAAMIPTSCIVIAEAILIGLGKTKLVAAYNIVENLIRTILCILAIFLDYGLTMIFIIFLAGRFLTAFFYLTYGGFYNVFSVRLQNTRFNMIPSYIKQIPVLFGILLFSVCIERMDIFMISGLLDLKNVGLYSAPYKIYELGLMVPTLMAVVLIPVLSSLFKDNMDKFNQLIMAVFRFILLCWTPVIVCFVFYSPVLMTLFFGAEFTDSGFVLQLLMPGLVFVGIANVFSVSLIVSNKANLELKVVALVAGAYAVQLFFFILQWGIDGAAIATLSISLLHPVIVYLLTKSHFDLSGLTTMAVKTLVAAVCMSLVLIFSTDMLGYFAIPVSMIAYLLFIIGERLVSTSEIKNYWDTIVLKVGEH